MSRHAARPVLLLLVLLFSVSFFSLIRRRPLPLPQAASSVPPPLTHPQLNDDTSSATTTTMTPPPPLRLAILEADKPQPQTRDRYGGYTGLFTSLLADAAATLSPPETVSQALSVTGFDIVHDLHTYPSLDDIDAVLITGSHHTAHDNDPWIIRLVDFARRAIDTGRVRVVGVCFGHQIVGRALGARLGRSDKGWEISVTEVNLTDKGRDIFGLNRMRIHQMHRDIVFDYPPESLPLGSNDICAVQGMYGPGRYLTVQGHPEFNEEIITEILFNRRTVGIFGEEEYQDAMKRAKRPHDGVTIARAFINFWRDG